MPSGHVFLASSLDGFIAREDGSLDWLPKEPSEGEDYGFEAMMARVDGLIMGRHTFEKVLSLGAWPYDKPVVVLSQKLAPAAIPENLRESVRLSQLSPRNLMQELEGEGWKNIYVDGGRLVQSFLQEGLIDHLTLTIIPTLLGTGRTYSGISCKTPSLQLIDTKIFGSGLVQVHYRVLKEGGETDGTSSKG